MKTVTFIAALMLFCMSCTSNKPLSDSEKQQITGEVKQLAEKIITAAEKADFDAVLSLGYDAPDNLIVTPDGKTITFKEWTGIVKNMFSSIQSQKINTIGENYMVLDRSTVWYTNVSSTKVNFKDGSVVMQSPWNMYLLARKIGNEWKLAAITEYGHEEIVQAATAKKELDQLELSKQLIARWRCEYADTIIMCDQQPFGKAQAASLRSSLNGKPFSETRQLWYYDKLHDRLNYISAIRDGGGDVLSLKFNTPTTYTIIPYANISNPAYAPYHIEGEFAADSLVEKLIINNETVIKYTSKKMK